VTLHIPAPHDLCARVLAAAIAVCLLGHAGRSVAQDRAEPRFYAPKPITEHAERRISVGVLAGYGATLNSNRIYGLNALGVGFGAAGGYDIDPIYVGLRLMFFLGDSRPMNAGVIKFDETTVGLEVGYKIQLGILVLRPELGFGLAMSNAELPDASTMTADLSSDDAYFSPGVALLTSLSRRVFIGLDAHLPFILRERTLHGLTFMIGCGMRF
jgi:hypothetical protein